MDEDSEGLMGKLLDMFAEAGVEVKDLRGTLPVHPIVDFDERELSDIQGIVIHHSAGWPQATAAGIAGWCVEKRSFPGMPYTFYLRMPYSHELRPAPWDFCIRLRDWGPQAYGVNSISFGVCIGGSYVSQRPARWVAESLDKLVGVLLQFFREEVGGKELWVKPHYQVSRTSCPGRVWEAYQDYKSNKE